MDTEQVEPTQSLVEILRRRAPWILVCFLLAAGVVYVYTKHETKKYTATAALAFNNNPLDAQIAGLSTTTNTTTSLLAQQNSNRELVRLSNSAAKTASLVGHGLTEEQVSSSVGVSAQGETTIIQVSATSTSPVLATAIANTYAREFVKEQQGANRQYFKSALALVHRQLAALPAAQRFGTDGLDLQERAQTLGLLAELNYGNVEVAQDAGVPTSPSSPKVHSDTILGGVLGVLLGVAIAFLLERFDRRIRKPEDLEAIYRLPMLGAVPKSRALASSARGDGPKDAALPSADAEAFGLIRAHLRFFNIGRDLRTVLIASPASGDGKTTIARHLAEAAAMSGSRVLLLEVDLRQPSLASQFDLQSATGLADALIGVVSIEEATQSVTLREPSSGKAGRTLDVLAAGSVRPPNPAELLESSAMDAMLRRARLAYDLVVIDTPPLVAVPDTFALLSRVDGVVIVGWVGHSRRDAAEELQQILAASDVPLLGVIANGATSSGARSYATAQGGKARSVTSAAAGSPAGEFAQASES